MTKISIIIPVFNVEKYLKRCVDSILEQKNNNFEIILVDDGSTDKSPEICDLYADQYSNVLVIHKVNSGPSDARNAGLDLATGEWVMFVDSDDYVRNDCFEKILRSLSNRVDLLIFGSSFFDETGQLIKQSTLDNSTFVLYGEQQKLDFVIQQLLMCKVGWEVWGKVFKRNLIEKYQLRFPKNIMIAEDQLFCVCYCMHSSLINIIKDHLYCYTVRQNSIMSDYGKRNNISTISRLSKYGYDHCLTFEEECKIFIKEYPIINYQILDVEFRRLEKLYGYSRKDFRSIILSSKHTDYLMDQFKGLIKNRKTLIKYFGMHKSMRIESDIRYYLNGCYFSSIIRNRVLRFMTPFIMKFDRKRDP